MGPQVKSYYRLKVPLCVHMYTLRVQTIYIYMYKLRDLKKPFFVGLLTNKTLNILNMNVWGTPNIKCWRTLPLNGNSEIFGSTILLLYFVHCFFHSFCPSVCRILAITSKLNGKFCYKQKKLVDISVKS